ncbi:MAG TPA: hypothetical protein VIJ10_14235 [Vicinamibacteria bacterium]
MSPSPCSSSIARRTTSSAFERSGSGRISFEVRCGMYQVASSPLQPAPVAASARRESAAAG